MEDTVQRKITAIRAIARTDTKYLQILRQLKENEDRLDAHEQKMTTEQRDAMWDFFGSRDELDQRLLEIACTCMEFPE